MVIKTEWTDKPLETQESGFPDDCISKGGAHDFVECTDTSLGLTLFVRICENCGWQPPLKLDKRNYT